MAEQYQDQKFTLTRLKNSCEHWGSSEHHHQSIVRDYISFQNPNGRDLSSKISGGFQLLILRCTAVLTTTRLF